MLLLLNSLKMHNCKIDYNTLPSAGNLVLTFNFLIKVRKNPKKQIFNSFLILCGHVDYKKKNNQKKKPVPFLDVNLSRGRKKDF